MKEPKGCKYGDNLRENFKDFKGRIGSGCDECLDKDCVHHKTHIEIEGFEQGYATARFPFCGGIVVANKKIPIFS